MTDKKKIYLIVPAAGEGVRMGSCASIVPKQYIIFDGRSILSHTIGSFININSINKIFVVTRSEHRIFYSEVQSGHCDKCFFVDCGGDTRSESVSNILHYIDNSRHHESPDYVVIHDAVRTGVSKDFINRLIDSITKNNLDGLIPISKSVNTMLFLDKNNINSRPSIVDRNNIFSILTPQIFSFSTLVELYSYKKEYLKYTDESSILLDYGYKVSYLECEDNNFKITHKKDLLLFNTLL